MQGTKPTDTFTLPFSVDLVSKARVTYKQDGEIILEKTEADCTLDGNIIGVVISEAETFEFTPNSYAYVQLRVLTTDNVPLKTPIYRIYIDESFNKEVLSE